MAKVILHIPPVIVQYGDDQKAFEHLPLVVRKDPRAFYQTPSVGIRRTSCFKSCAIETISGERQEHN
jgi:hypothetical protein